MTPRIFNAIAGRLSLRPPQRESLQRLAQALGAAPAMREHEPDLDAVLAALKAEFPTLEAFERDFPSLCFALATRVGKTRLIGALIGYLHLTYGFRHFFVLAPNLTIYNKLIADFTPNTPKYVFTGIAEFAAYPPEIITGDNYEQRAGNLSILSPVTVNILVISTKAQPQLSAALPGRGSGLWPRSAPETPARAHRGQRPLPRARRAS